MLFISDALIGFVKSLIPPVYGPASVSGIGTSAACATFVLSPDPGALTVPGFSV